MNENNTALLFSTALQSLICQRCRMDVCQILSNPSKYGDSMSSNTFYCFAFAISLHNVECGVYCAWLSKKTDEYGLLMAFNSTCTLTFRQCNYHFMILCVARYISPLTYAYTAFLCTSLNYQSTVTPRCIE